MGRNLMHLLDIPALWHVSTTCVTSLYDSGASSITNFGDATRIEIPCEANLSSTCLEQRKNVMDGQNLKRIQYHLLVA